MKPTDNKSAKVEQALEGLDFTDLAFRLSQLALKAISGKEIETKEYDIKLAVPSEIAEVVEAVCVGRDVDPTTIFTAMASQNFNAAIRSKIQEETNKKDQSEQTQDVASQVAAATGFDTGKMMEGMSQLQGLAKQLQGLQGVLQNANQATAATNPQQPDVSPSEVPGNKTGKE